MNSLQQMILSDNLLTGTIDPALSLAPKLMVFDVSLNSLSGTVIPQFSSSIILELA